jgi:protein-disulfide isomerase
MKTLTILISLVLAASTAAAQEVRSAVDMTALHAWASKTLPRCPGGQMTFDPVPGRGPSGFQAYRAVLKSDDEHCSASRFILYSPLTDQTLVGSIIAIPGGEAPLHVRLSDHASKLLNTTVKANIAPIGLPDGLKPVSLVKQTQYGPFSYNGYVDASDRYLIIGMRGSLKEDPAVTLKKVIGADRAARRGNGAAKVEIIEISDFQCPTCARAHEALEPLFSKNLGKISYSRIDLPLFENHKWALQAALGARAINQVAPAKYWEYVDYIFKNQASIDPTKFDQLLQDWVEDNDVKWPAVSKIYKSESERKALLESVTRLFAAGVASTPTFIVNGEFVTFGDGTFATAFFKQALGIK